MASMFTSSLWHLLQLKSQSITSCCITSKQYNVQLITINKSNMIEVNLIEFQFDATGCERRFKWVEIQSIVPVENAHICNKLQPRIKAFYVRKVSWLLDPFRLFCYITQFSPNSIVPIQNFINWMHDQLTRFCGLPLSNFRVLKCACMFICLITAILTCKTAFRIRITEILCHCSEWVPSNPCKYNLHKVKKKTKLSERHQ